MRKKLVLLMILAAALMALPVMAQTFGTQQTEQQGLNAAPSASFQSTNTMTGSGSAYSSNPTLNNDGTATYEGASYSPAKAPAAGPKKVGGQTIEGPVGDALLPLMLMAGAFALFIYFRRKRSAA